MKKSVTGGILFLALLVLSAAPPAFSQPAPASKYLRIKGVKIQKQKTPEYDVQGVNMGRGQIQQWLQILTSFETAPDWMDQVDFTYYALVKSKDGPTPFSMFRSTVSYVNVEKGTHLSEMYLHPSSLKRYGDVERVAVIVRVNGQLAAIESEPSSNQRWWEQFPPVDGTLLNRNETPFSLINFDNYPAVKASGTTR